MLVRISTKMTVPLAVLGIMLNPREVKTIEVSPLDREALKALRDLQFRNKITYEVVDDAEIPADLELQTASQVETAATTIAADAVDGIEIGGGGVTFEEVTFTVTITAQNRDSVQEIPVEAASGVIVAVKVERTAGISTQPKLSVLGASIDDGENPVTDYYLPLYNAGSQDPAKALSDDGIGYGPLNWDMGGTASASPVFFRNPTGNLKFKCGNGESLGDPAPESTFVFTLLIQVVDLPVGW